MLVPLTFHSLVAVETNDNSNDAAAEKDEKDERKDRKRLLIELGAPVKRTRPVDYDDDLDEVYGDLCTSDRSDEEDVGSSDSEFEE